MRRTWILLLLLGGCERTDWGPAALGSGETSATRRQLELGRDVYGTYCVGCHGESGDGNGHAARFLDPKPRDFRLGRLKFAAVASGEAPRDDDYLRILEHGLSGTAMPSFALLPERERRAVIAYLREFVTPAQREASGAALAVGKDPWADDPARGVTEGRKVYHAFAKCWACHPAYETPTEIARLLEESKLPAAELRPNLYESETKESQWGAPIRAPDFLRDRIKTGLEVASLATVINAGVGGTAMPTWSGALSPEQLWGIAHYVRSLSLLRGTAEAGQLTQRLQGGVR
jgi:mono/diheme cytochrome c family protein